MILLGMQFLPFFLGQWITTKGVRGPKEQMFVMVKSFGDQLPSEIKHLTDVVNTLENTRKEKESEDKPQERDLLAENCELTEKVFLSKFALERFSSNDDDIFFYTEFQSYKALLAFFLKPSAESLLSWNQARFKDLQRPSRHCIFLLTRSEERNTTKSRNTTNCLISCGCF